MGARDEDEIKECTKIKGLAEDKGRVEAAPNKTWGTKAR